MPNGLIAILIVFVLLFVAVAAVPGVATNAGPLLLYLVVAVAALFLVPALRRLVVLLVVAALFTSMMYSAVNTQYQEAKRTVSSATSAPRAMLETVKETLFGPGVWHRDEKQLSWEDSLLLGYRRFEGTPFVQGAADRCCIDSNDITQGAIGDCWMLASLGALAVTSPGTVARAIRDNGDGTYDVTLYRKEGSKDAASFTPEIIRVDNLFPAYRWPFFMWPGTAAPVYAQIGDTGSDGTAELWVLVLEKAFALRNLGYSSIHGGLGYDALEVMTGRPSIGVLPASIPRSRLASLLSSLHASGYAITAGTLADEAQLPSLSPSTRDLFKRGPDQKLVTQHEYFVRRFDAATETLEMGNPHGNVDGAPHIPADAGSVSRGLQPGLLQPSRARGGSRGLPMFVMVLMVAAVDSERPQTTEQRATGCAIAGEKARAQ